MADNDIDLYADDIDQDFAQDDFGGDNVDLYDDVIAAPAASNSTDEVESKHTTATTPANVEETNGTTYSTQGNNITPNVGRRHQLYVGNLTWWTTDQDIANTIHDIGVNDFHEVKFFEHRANGQSKGFCVISLGSESSARLCLEHLPKKEINGQNPVVTLPTKQALSNFESQSKTRPSPSNNSNNRSQHPNNSIPPGGSHHQNFGGNSGGGGGGGGGNRMPPMNNQMRGGPMPANMVGPGGNGPPRMQGPPGISILNHYGQGQPPRFQGQPQWNGPRPNGPGPAIGPMRPGPPLGPQCPPRPMDQFQGPPQGQGPPRGMPAQGPPPVGYRAGPDWSRPPMQQGFPPQGGPPHMPGTPNPMGGGLRGPPPMGMPPNSNSNNGRRPSDGIPAPHVNAMAFFPQGGGGGGAGGPPPPPPQMQQLPGDLQMGPAQVGGPPPNSGVVPHGYGPQMPPQMNYGGPPPPPDLHPHHHPHHHHHRPDMPPISEQEFEDIMSRNRTVSSSAIARAVSDAAAGEYASAIETLVTAISLIKQSKVSNDDRCKILISSLQDTLRGVEDKSYSSGGSSSRRDRSRSRDRQHSRRGRRERSSSRYRDRSRDRDRDRDRDRYYTDSYRERDRERDRSRSRGGGGGGGGGGGAGCGGERERDREYRDRETEDVSRVSRSRNKSPPDGVEASGEPTSKSRYYEDRYRDRDSGRSRESDRDRERDRRDESHRSRH